LTSRELAKLIKKYGIIFQELPDEKFDAPFGLASGAGLIFGATGGVMEAALRTLAEVITGKEAQNIDFTEVRGTDGIKEAEYDLGGTKVKVAVAHGLKNAREIMNRIKNGTADYHFIEIMSCPGGCVNGGGQPIKSAYIRNNYDVKALRAKAIYDTDKAMTLRKSHANEAVQTLYAEFFGEPNSHKAHEILHTHYEERKNY
jgi:NADP-reducing hydrogenase subunit HndD